MTILEYIVDYLGDRFDVPVRVEKPSDLDEVPERYILVEKTGFSIKNFICTATVAIQAHAEQLYAAEDMIVNIRKAMFDMAEDHRISDVKLDSDYPWPDASRKEDRYQAVFQITHYLED